MQHQHIHTQLHTQHHTHDTTHDTTGTLPSTNDTTDSATATDTTATTDTTDATDTLRHVRDVLAAQSQLLRVMEDRDKLKPPKDSPDVKDPSAAPLALSGGADADPDADPRPH